MAFTVGDLIKLLTSDKKKGPKVDIKFVDVLLDALRKDHTDELETFQPQFFLENAFSKITPETTDSVFLINGVLLNFIASKYGFIVLNDINKIDTLVTRLQQLYGKQNTSLQHKAIIIDTFTSLVYLLQNTSVRKIISPIFSILSWKHIPNYDQHLKNSETNVQELFVQENTRFEGLNAKEKVQRSLLSSFIQRLINNIEILQNSNDTETILFSISVINFLSSVLSQLPTRRFTKLVIQESNILVVAELRDTHNVNYLQSVETLKYFLNYPVDELTGELIDSAQLKLEYSNRISSFQSYAYTTLNSELSDLISEHSKNLRNGEYLENQLSKLDLDSLKSLSDGLNVTKSRDSLSKQFLLKLLVDWLKEPIDYASFFTASDLLFDKEHIQKYSQISSEYLPRLGPQYLSVQDLLLRSLIFGKFDLLRETYQYVLSKSTLIQKKNNNLSITTKYGSEVSDIKELEPRNDLFRGSFVVDLTKRNSDSITLWQKLSKDELILLLTVDEANQKKKSVWGNVEEVVSIKVDSVVRGEGKSNKTLVIEFSTKSSKAKIHSSNAALLLPTELKKKTSRISLLRNIINEDENFVSSSSLDLVLGTKVSTATQDAHRGYQKVQIYLNDANDHAVTDIFPGFKHDSTESSKRRKGNSGAIDPNFKHTGPVEITLDNGSIDLKHLSSSVDTVISRHHLSSSQIGALISSTLDGVTFVDGAPGTGKSFLAHEITRSNIKNHSSQRNLILSKYDHSLNEVFKHYGDSDQHYNLSDSKSLIHKVESSKLRLVELLTTVDEISTSLKIDGAHGNDPTTALNFYEHHIKPIWRGYLNNIKTTKSNGFLVDGFPFSEWIGDSSRLSKDNDFNDNLDIGLQEYLKVAHLFDDISKLAPYSFLSSDEDKLKYLLKVRARVVGLEIEDFNVHSEIYLKNINFENVVFLDAQDLDEVETIVPLLSKSNANLQRLTLLGDYQKSKKLSVGQSDSNLYRRTLDSGVTAFKLQERFGYDSSLTEVLKPLYPEITSSDSGDMLSNAGLLETTQIIEIPNDKSSVSAQPGQRFEEALFALHLYFYLRVIGYERKNIIILTDSSSQFDLIEELANKKYSAKDVPSTFTWQVPLISTIDLLANRTTDIVIFSTSSYNNLNAISSDRILIGASFARKGFYLLCSPEILNNWVKKNLFSTLTSKSKKLLLVPNEKYGQTNRKVIDSPTSTAEVSNHEEFASYISEKVLQID